MSRHCRRYCQTRIGTRSGPLPRRIRVRVDIDGTGRVTVETPIGFRDHLLTCSGATRSSTSEVHAGGDCRRQITRRGHASSRPRDRDALGESSGPRSATSDCDGRGLAL